MASFSCHNIVILLVFTLPHLVIGALGGSNNNDYCHYSMTRRCAPTMTSAAFIEIKQKHQQLYPTGVGRINKGTIRSCYSPSLYSKTKSGIIINQSTTTRSSTTTTTTLYAVPPTVPPEALKAAAIGFFGGIRVPSTLVLGTSVASLFALSPLRTSSSSSTNTLDEEDDKSNNCNNHRSFKSFVYTTCTISCICAICLSLITIYTSTAVCTQLLLGVNKFDASPYTDTYHFLKGTFNFAFITARWSFLNSIFCLIITLGCRIMIHFGLTEQEGKEKLQKSSSISSSSSSLSSPRVLAFSIITGMLAHMMSYINTSLNCWPNMIMMTKEVLQLFIHRGVTNFQRYPLELVAIVSFMIAIVSGLKCAINHYGNDIN